MARKILLGNVIISTGLVQYDLGDNSRIDLAGKTPCKTIWAGQIWRFEGSCRNWEDCEAVLG